MDENKRMEMLQVAREMLEQEYKGVTFYKFKDYSNAIFEVDHEDGYARITVDLYVEDEKYLEYKKEFILVCPDFDYGTDGWYITHEIRVFDAEHTEQWKEEESIELKDYKSWAYVPRFLDKQELPAIIAN